MTRGKIPWLIAAALLLGCSTTPEEVTLSRDPTYFLVGSTSGDPQTIFSSRDEKVVLRVVFSPNFVGGSRVFTAEWIDPRGKLYLSEPVKTKWGNNETLFATLFIANNEPSQMPGRWRVRLLYEGDELVSRTFTID